MKRQPPESPLATSQVSGKLVIISILAVALAGAAASWYFRYNATHRAAEFWGPEAARLIRDAPNVRLTRETRNAQGMTTESITRDASSARGMTHLRTALLEDRSFEWPATELPPSTPGGWRLEFSNDSSGETLSIFFTPGLIWATHYVSEGEDRSVVCMPIAKGLREMFTEIIGESAAMPAGDAR